MTERPVLSTNRNFSAPIRLTANLSADDLRLMARATAIRSTAGRRCRRSRARFWSATSRGSAPAKDPEADEGLLNAVAAILADKTLEPAFIAEALSPPSEADIAARSAATSTRTLSSAPARRSVR